MQASSVKPPPQTWLSAQNSDPAANTDTFPLPFPREPGRRSPRPTARRLRVPFPPSAITGLQTPERAVSGQPPVTKPGTNGKGGRRGRSRAGRKHKPGAAQRAPRPTAPGNAHETIRPVPPQQPRPPRVRRALTAAYPAPPAALSRPRTRPTASVPPPPLSARAPRRAPPRPAHSARRERGTLSLRPRLSGGTGAAADPAPGGVRRLSPYGYSATTFLLSGKSAASSPAGRRHAFAESREEEM